jgi:hypothetical protein
MSRKMGKKVITKRSIWEPYTNCVLNARDEVCGWMKENCRHVLVRHFNRMMKCGQQGRKKDYVQRVVQR